ncbi:hypothetical protein MTR67_027639 [Solanum verrucosum]|uniref:Uncharacterized protein n=1 Tax=Solanum verrucosum TaxID=315347 RepID=A0AAF0TVW2_SOLVR|nr:hypothetical protein MTR67_027639 [Solanum verrucosum]
MWLKLIGVSHKTTTLLSSIPLVLHGLVLFVMGSIRSWCSPATNKISYRDDGTLSKSDQGIEK